MDQFVGPGRDRRGEGGIAKDGQVEPASTDELGRDRERRIKKRGIQLASAGLGLALACIVFFRAAGLSEHGSWTVVIGLGGLTVLVQGVLWLIPHVGWDRALGFDPDYVLVPLTAAALLLFSYMAAVPEARALLLVGWFAALLFGLRFLGFWDVAGLGGLVTVLYMGALAFHLEDPEAHGLTWRVEATQAAVVFAIHVFAAGVFRRVRREREEKEELRERLAEEAITDPLMGLRNRRYLDEYLETEVARARRYETPCSLAILDLDHFKRYNDAHGHPAGDQVLQVVAEVLREEAREADVVARYGGEEFAVVMPETDWEEALRGCERMRQAVEDTPVDGEDVLPGGLTVSIGVASVPDHAGSAAELLEAADRALYQAKDRGRNQVVSPVQESTEAGNR